MDQVKIGQFLKQLRKENGYTQEQLAEKLLVTNRSVSRWETGSNLPDLELLVELANLYEVELEELLDGERKNKMVDEQLHNTILKVVDYSNDEKKRITNRVKLITLVGLIAFSIYLLLTLITDTQSGLLGAIKGLSLGFAYSTLIINYLYSNNQLEKIKTKIKVKLKSN